jgi:hypothetical protein
MSEHEGSSSAAQGSNDADSGAAARLARIKKTPIIDLTSAEVFQLVCDAVPFVQKFEPSWRLSGLQLLSFGPTNFVQAIQSEIILIPRSAIVEIFQVVQKKYVQDTVSGNDAVKDFLKNHSVWSGAATPSTFAVSSDAGPISSPFTPGVQPKVLSDAFSPTPFGAFTHHGHNGPQKIKFQFGGPTRVRGNVFTPDSMFTPSSTMVHQYPGLSFALAQQNLSQSQSALLSSSAPMTAMFGSAALNATSSAMIHPAPLHAMPNSANTSTTAMPNSATFRPSSPSVTDSVMNDTTRQTTMSPPLLGSDEQQLAQILANPLLGPLFVKYAGTVVSSHQADNRTPWDIAAEARGPFVQDPSLPIGYKRIKIDLIIQDAKQARVAAISQNGGMVDTAKAQKYPVMKSFNEEEFRATRVAYYDCVMSNTSGIFSTFKSCFSTLARNTACSVFKLDISAWLKLDDQVCLDWCAYHFGPIHKNDALRILRSIRIKHNDADDSQAAFVAKFDLICYEHELAINDIADCCRKWPTDSRDINSAALTDKEIRKEWMEIFPKQERSVFSHQLKICRAHIQGNADEPFNEQIVKLRNEFDMKDRKVKGGYEVYNTQPGRQSSSRYSPFKKFDSEVTSSNAPKYLGKREQYSQRGDREGKRFQAAANEVRRPRPIVAGHLRGIACGSTNSHFGLGCSKKTCYIFGTKYDKSLEKGHVWKSSADEESVFVEEAIYKQLVADRPGVADAWKQARSSRRKNVRVSALSAGQEPDGDEFDQNAIDEDDEQHSDSNDHSSSDSEVNATLYSQCGAQVAAVEFSGGASKLITKEELLFTAKVAAVTVEATVTDPWKLLGHEEQFYGVVRFASNNDFTSKALLDPGATINIICPTLANRSAIRRKQLSVSIFQGNRKQASVDEMVECAFELMDISGTWVRHLEWFAVCELGYDVLLGRRFCRIQGFTSFDTKLKNFNTLPPRPHALLVSALRVQRQVFAAFFDRNDEAGRARYKRAPKRVICVTNNAVSSIGLHIITASNPLSALRLVDDKVVDGKRQVLLSFKILCQQNEQSATMQHWFHVHEDDTFDAGFDSDFVRELMTNMHPWQRLTNEMPEVPLAAWKLSNVSAPLSKEEVNQRKADITKQANRVGKLNDLKFASYHPVKGYRLMRSAAAPISPHWKKDHLNHYAQKDFRGERAAINAAIDADNLARLCRRKERKFQGMVSALESLPKDSRGLSPNINCWLDAAIVESDEVRADVAVSSATDSTEQTTGFQPREYAEIAGAQIQTELNGHRVRLYSKEGTDMWVISVLGAAGKKYLCHERFLKKLSHIEQQRSIPSGARASLEECGIDAAGQPNIELRSLAHRQFGAEYSKELTLRIEALKARFPQVFTEDVSEPCDFEPMKIKLVPNAVLPAKAKYYRNTPKMREEIRRQIQEQLSWGAIRKCVTPCVSDVLLVKRPHMPGKFRFVVNYVKLNDATVKEQLLMPDAKSQHERLVGCCIFGAIDFSSYYRQIRLHEDSQYLTGFASDEGTYCYTRVPMGVTGACQWAQKVLQEALAEDECWDL